jgi:hypothetical protein
LHVYVTNCTLQESAQTRPVPTHTRTHLQVKIWRRHLHKFDDMDMPTAQAAAAALEQRVAAVRSERRQAAAAQRKVRVGC